MVSSNIEVNQIICIFNTVSVPDDWLLKNKRPVLHGREVIKVVLATWQASAKDAAMRIALHKNAATRLALQQC